MIIIIISRAYHCATLYQLSNCVHGVLVVQNDAGRSINDPPLSATIIAFKRRLADGDTKRKLADTKTDTLT